MCTATFFMKFISRVLDSEGSSSYTKRYICYYNIWFVRYSAKQVGHKLLNGGSIIQISNTYYNNYNNNIISLITSYIVNSYTRIRIII